MRWNFHSFHLFQIIEENYFFVDHLYNSVKQIMISTLLRKHFFFLMFSSVAQSCPTFSLCKILQIFIFIRCLIQNQRQISNILILISFYLIIPLSEWYDYWGKTIFNVSYLHSLQLYKHFLVPAYMLSLLSSGSIWSNGGIEGSYCLVMNTNRVSQQHGDRKINPNWRKGNHYWIISICWVLCS